MCRNCSTSQRRSRSKKGVYDIGSLNAQSIFDTVASDLVGPISYFQESYYLFTMIDHFSKWSEIAILTEITADTIAEAFLVYWVQRFGIPKRIITDRGANFMKAFDHECEQYLGTKHIKTSSYHPEGNGVCEAFHIYLKSTLPKLLVGFPNTKFEILVAMALINYKSTPHSTTAETPFTLMTGMDFKLPSIFHTV